MKYKYPKFVNWISIHHIKGTERYIVKDHLYDSEYEFGNAEYVRFAKALDGKTDPYSIKTRLLENEIDYFLEWLKDNDLLRYSRVIHAGIGSALFSVYYPKRATPIKRILARILNWLLLISFIPVFVVGCHYFVKADIEFSTVQTVLGYILGIVIGMIFHEFFGHGLANIGYNHCGLNYEIGVFVQYFIMFGAYVMIDEQEIKNRFHRIQVLAAGVEQNFLLAGISFILSFYYPSLSCLFFYIGVTNALLACLNLLLVEGLDGCNILCELLGCENNILEQARKAVIRRIKSHSYKGSTTKIKALSSCFILLMQIIAYPVILLINVIGVVSWFL